MGVKGLKSYIEKQSGVLETRTFSDRKLIIDGSNLYYSLYFHSNLDQAHGGEYDVFVQKVRVFFRNLRNCKIKPYVVLDGGDDISDKKFVTLKKRSEDRIKRANRLSRGQSGEVLPILIKNVFKQLLRKLNVPFIQCIAEADWECAALANQWNCPVLSNDSDFYIFNIRAGFLPLSYFNWQSVKTRKKSGQKYIQAKWYSVLNLCATLDHMNERLLPIFATILGNDYANLESRLFPNWNNFSRLSEGPCHIDGLLRWLSRFQNPEEAINRIRSTINNRRDSVNVFRALVQGLEEYSLSNSSIAQFFKNKAPQSGLPLPLQQLPKWFLMALAEGKLNSILLDVLTLHRVTLNISVQDFKLCSNNLASRPIRQVIYGLMLGPKQQEASRPRAAAAEKEWYEVEEYDREGITLSSSKVAAILPTLHLTTLWEESQHGSRLQVFLDALCVSQALDRLPVPPNTQLAVYVTCYWLKFAKPEPRPEFFWALLIGLVYGELARDPKTAKGTLPNRLKELKSHNGKKNKRLPDLAAAHAFSQWQCTLRDSICLSQLLANPVPEPEYAWLYSGLFLHRVLNELQRGITPESLLAKAPLARQLYDTLRAAVERELDGALVERMRVQVSRVQPVQRPAPQDPLEDISNRFQYLRHDEDTEDEDLHKGGKKGKASNRDDEILEQTCTPRTRHRAKRRTSKMNSKSKKYERSCY